MNVDRRSLLLLAGGAAVAAWFVWPAIERRLPRDLAFEPLAEPPGFRQYLAGQVSDGLDPFVGLGDTRAAGAPPPLRGAALCAALFGPEPLPAQTVPVALFTDYNCPYCRILDDLVLKIAERAPNVRVVWHDWPALGPDSVIMARAAAAAARQGAYLRMHRSLMRSRFVPTPEYLADLARRLDIDAERLFADMRSPEVVAEIEQSTALARQFGFRGTPSLVVGRTAVTGAIDERALEVLIRQERREGPPPGCA
jgi:protein-disulfide isomerase